MRTPHMHKVVVVVAAVVLGGCGWVAGATRSSDGQPANGGVSSGPTTSADGRYVGFNSEATNLVPGDTNGVMDVFVRDMLNGTTERISLATGGGNANGWSEAPQLSADGQRVVFKSEASNLVPGDTNGVADVFVADRSTGAITRVSVTTDGTQADGVSALYAKVGISADGTVAVFGSHATNLVPDDTNDTVDAFAHDLVTGVTELVSVATDGTHGDGWSGDDIHTSADGRFVVFASASDNLVAGDSGSYSDAFVRDRLLGITERVSLASDGSTEGDGGVAQGIWITGDGRFVSFRSWASNLVPDDTNGTVDVFVYDRTTDLLERVSVASGGGEAHGEGYASDVSMSDDGRFVLFDAYARDLVPSDGNGAEDVFVHDRETGLTNRVSLAPSSAEGNSASGNSQISADGRYAAYGTVADNIIPNDRYGTYDIAVAFVARPRVSSVVPGTLVQGSTGFPVTIHGSWLMPDASVVFGPGVTVRDLVVLDGRTMTATLDVAADAPVGPQNPIVTNPGSGAGARAKAGNLCLGCFTVTAA